MARKKSKEPGKSKESGKGEEVNLSEQSNVVVIPTKPIDEEYEKRTAGYPRWRPGLSEGDAYYDDMFRAWMKIYRTVEGELQNYFYKDENNNLQMVLVDGVPTPCDAEGNPEGSETIESAYAKFRNELATTWIPARAMNALHILDCLIGLKSAHFEGSDPIPILELQVAELNRWMWGYAKIKEEDIERLQATPEHIAERAMLEKKSSNWLPGSRSQRT
jgi:hypothetical protein